jgi:hypothetical protein
MQDTVIELKPKESADDSRIVKRWLARIEREKKAHEDFRDEAEYAFEVYDDTDDEIIYPLLWSVVQIQSAACYSSVPVPDIRTRSTTSNQVHRDAALVMQRALEFYVDQTEFDSDMKRVVNDWLVTGLGVPRVKIDATIVDQPVMDPMTGEPQIDPETFAPMSEPLITDQLVRIEHHPWDRFGWEPTTNWAHVEWIYFEHHLTRAEIRRRWGEDVNVPTEEERKHKARRKSGQKLYVVYEIWCKRKREVIIIAEGNEEPLEVIDDPLGLVGFFPCPPPLMLNCKYDETIPKPDYSFIEELDEEIQRLYKRSKVLTEQVKPFSFHDASIVELESMSEVRDGDSVPVTDLQARFGDSADLRRLILFHPMQEKVAALAEVTKQLQMKRQHVDDILGISDILRGSANPQDGQETQKIKERWAGIRLRPKQVAVQHMIRGLFRIMSELTVEHVTRENLAGMTQVMITDEVYALLQDDVGRMFAVDIETDSTIAKDEMADRQARTELLQAITQYVQVVAPAMNQNMIPATLGREILQVATDPYKRFSKGLDDVISNMEQTQQQLQKQQQQINQGQQQIQSLQQEIEKKDYALNQFSLAEETRQDIKTASDAEAKHAKATKDLAGVPDDQIQPRKTIAEVEKLQADTFRTLNPVQGE